MNIFELIASPLFPVSEYWGAYLFILFLTGFLKTEEEDNPKQHAEHLASVALDVCGYVTSRSLVMNLNGQNNAAIKLLAAKIDRALIRANRNRKQSDMELI